MPSLSPTKEPTVFTTVTLQFNTALTVDTYGNQEELENIASYLIQGLLEKDWEVCDVTLTLDSASTTNPTNCNMLSAPSMNPSPSNIVSLDVFLWNAFIY